MWKKASISTWRPATSSSSPTLNTSARTPCASAPPWTGRADAEIHFDVNYTPTLANYSAAAWPLRENYDQLVRLYAQWQDRVFLCVGKIVDIIEEDGEERMVMDISGDGEQLVILVNDSNFGTPMLGETYSIYAHVSAHEEGRYMYNATYYPQLIALYMDLYTN